MYFDISPQTFYRWKRRYDPGRLRTLGDSSHRPQRLRQPSAPAPLVEAIRQLREEHPRWGKNKLVLLVRRKHDGASTSMVGRILKRLKERGVLREPVPRVSVHRHQYARPYGVRKPKGYIAREPGDLVEVDTLDVRPVPGVVWKHFTARDGVSRWNVLGVYRSATATSAAQFLDVLAQRIPFPHQGHPGRRWLGI